MPKKHKKRYVKKKNTKKRKFRRVILALLFITACVISFCLFTPIFNIQSIVIKGSDQISSEQIEQTSGIIYQTNIFKMNKNKVMDNLNTIAYIKEIKVKRKLPSKVEITVTETYPALCFPFMTGYIVTDYTGKVLEQHAEPVTDLPLILGVEIEKAEISQKMTIQDSIKFDIILNCISDLEKTELMPDIVKMDFSDISGFFVYLKSGLKIIFGKISDMSYKLSVLDTVLPQVEKTQGAYVDLTIPSRAFYGRDEKKSTASPSPTPDTNTTEGENTGE